MLLLLFGRSGYYLLAGVGFGMVIISAVVCVYYNVIIAWTIYYFVLSFAWELPWSTCNNDWNSPNCYTRSSNSSQFNGINDTDRINFTRNNTRSPSEEFFELVFHLSTFVVWYHLVTLIVSVLVLYWSR